MDYKKLSGDRLGKSSESIRKRVQSAQDIQLKRFLDSMSGVVGNADMRVGGDKAFLQAAGRRSEFDACCNESNEFIGKSLSSNPETDADNCRSGRR